MMQRKFTGWHMTGILVAFFTVVVSVNIVMARAAIGTFGGAVVENSYVASQKFNSWLDKAEAQKALGWQVKTGLLPDRRVAVDAFADGRALHGLGIGAVVRHPLGHVPETKLSFVAAGDGRWVSTAPLPQGRWTVHLAVRRGGDDYRVVETLR
jgi:nitrogen fixation protein FixH